MDNKLFDGSVSTSAKRYSSGANNNDGYNGDGGSW